MHPAFLPLLEASMELTFLQFLVGQTMIVPEFHEHC
jgi:hypothetical protein